MPITTAALAAQVRRRLDETTVVQFDDNLLIDFINDATHDIARKTMQYRDVENVVTVGGVNEYTLTRSVLQIDHAYFISQTDPTRAKPLVARSFSGMDQVWGEWQNGRDDDPVAFTTWGFPPNLKLKVYPTPVTSGDTIRLHMRRIPTRITSLSGTNLDAPEAWLDLIADYVEAYALRKDRDPRWQEAWAMYQQKRDEMSQMGDDAMAATTDMIIDPWAGAVPSWLVYGD